MASGEFLAKTENIEPPKAEQELSNEHYMDNIDGNDIQVKN